jgi:sortase (surface protein transpeptidase)
MKGKGVAAGVIGSLVAASAVLGLLAGCVAAPSGGGAATGAPPATEPATAESSPAALPRTTGSDVPIQSAELEDQRREKPPAPTRIEVPALGIDMAIKPVGLDAQGNMGLFDDPTIAAWYQWGPAPASETGSAVIAAHVDSLEYRVLPFAKLRDARAGTLVIVTDAAGTRHSFGVDSLEVIEKGVVDWEAAFDRSGTPRLTLVTCGGEFDYETRTYRSNLVLTATPR